MAREIASNTERIEKEDNSSNVGSSAGVQSVLLIAESLAMKTVRHRAEAIARVKYPVLVEGETGTGKSLLAKCIHLWSARRDKPFVQRGCGEFEPNLLAATLFGNVKGAYTGAETAREGLLVEAKGGTLCLDDIDYLPVSAQSKLLRFLDDGRVFRLGEHNQASELEVRVIATTNKRIDHLVDRGLFLPDLLHRLRQMPLRLPPLRNRPEDIKLLAQHFLSLSEESGEEGKGHDPARKFTDDALELFGAMQWPGNIRQLRAAVTNVNLFSPPCNQITLDTCIKVLFDREHGLFTQDENQSPLDGDDSWLLRILTITGGNILATSRITGHSRTTIYNRIEINRWPFSVRRGTPR